VAPGEPGQAGVERRAMDDGGFIRIFEMEPS
jgi:hypothetical protein